MFVCVNTPLRNEECVGSLQEKQGVNGQSRSEKKKFTVEQKQRMKNVLSRSATVAVPANIFGTFSFSSTFTLIEILRIPFSNPHNKSLKDFLMLKSKVKQLVP